MRSQGSHSWGQDRKEVEDEMGLAGVEDGLGLGLG